MYKLTNEEFIRRCKEKHGDKYLYDKVNYVDDKTNILIGCRQRGYFWQNPRNHYKLGCGCPICAGNLKETTESFIVKAQKVHGDFYFCCDFYITSLDLFIELNAFWSHGGHWYDSSSILDLQKLRGCMAKDKVFYKCVAEVWTKADVKKRQVAAKKSHTLCSFLE